MGKPTASSSSNWHVVIHRDLAVIEKAKEVAQEWLKGIGLELKPSKTRITHTLDKHQGNVGFDFLGFNIRQHRVGKCHHRTGGNNKTRLDFKTLITPSPEAVKRHYRAVAQIVDQHRSAPQIKLIGQLNPVIRGWSNYYSRVVAKATFSKLDHLLHWKLFRWARRRNNHSSWQKRRAAYWRLDGKKRRRNFQTPEGVKLLHYADTVIKRHTKVKAECSPYDGDWTYWGKRLLHYPMLSRRKQILLEQQKGRCRWCGLYFKAGDVVEVDHLIPRCFGGKDQYRNLQLLHAHCHDDKSAHDGSTIKTDPEGIIDNDHFIEERCERETLTHRSASAAAKATSCRL